MNKINTINYITYQTFPANTANSLQTISNIKYLLKNNMEINLIFFHSGRVVVVTAWKKLIIIMEKV